MKSQTLTFIQVCCVLACVGGAATQVLAQTKLEGKDQGRQFAERLCSNCHDVSPDASSTSSRPARSFRLIAKQPGQTSMRLAGAIIMPHPEMPNVPLTRAEIRSIVAYIQSLKPNGKK